MTPTRVADSAVLLHPHHWQLPVDEPDAGSQPLIRAGFGACAKSGCRCRHYQGLAGNCANEGCRHSIGDHW